ncbi:VOC family protein [Flavobacterium olei]|uniref:VOC family protein n=1 Tax=Flavobacterium olei TaxID=1886782 RepID=UPI003218E14D
MATVNPYLLFNGTCEEAFLFYKSVFGGEFPHVGRYKDAPLQDGEAPLSEADSNQIMHISLSIGNTILMGSDSHPRYGDVVFGDNISVTVNPDSREETEKIFNGLSAGGKVEMPLNDTFWGAYFGMFKDKFGINWMVNFDKNVPNK